MQVFIPDVPDPDFARPGAIDMLGIESAWHVISDPVTIERGQQHALLTSSSVTF